MEIQIPKIAESIREAYLAQWYKQSGDFVKKNMPVLSLETDKISLEIKAEEDGILNILVAQGETVPVGTVVATIAASTQAKDLPTPEKVSAGVSQEKISKDTPPSLQPLALSTPEKKAKALFGPKVQKLLEETKVDVSQIVPSGPGGRITRNDVLFFMEEKGIPFPSSLEKKAAPEPKKAAEEETLRKPMSPLRKKIAEKMLEGKNSTAMLTTFNEVDMTKVMQIRKEYKEEFQKKYNVSLGIMSFFIKASIEALKEYPQVNAFIEGNDLVYHNYYHIGVAIGSEKGLIVPVIRHAERLGFAEIEKAIKNYVQKIEEKRLELSDLEGGTFTVSNGGVYGSLLSTPILNMPQSGILGMHSIQDRPIAINGQVVIRPMMYIALSYDHRIIDGRESVQFLKRIKQCIENPERILVEI
ncbi:MAG: 2-oxoglutarate dehydrogenase complex dihydrolipoyllysine-residue succinyltransferase [Candidatus Brocadiae bacterium]|nr:2-oxoglutarate dehydrogenase complex dihydrolipoyllysine-residue succinyltransferase [Candidatus Brocadiia bacterium]